jgi:hypothetical protein
MNLTQSLQEIQAIVLESFYRVPEDQLTRHQQYLLHSMIILAEIYDITKLDLATLGPDIQWSINLNKYSIMFKLANSQLNITTNDFPGPDQDTFYRFSRTFNLADSKSFEEISKCCLKIIKGMIPDNYTNQLTHGGASVLDPVSSMGS